ncbi:MAG: hypothetical protein V3S18_05105, partial [Dehalococcoidia bacterium]
MSQSRARQPSAPARARSLLDLAIEGAWLAGVGLIPVVYSGRGWLVFAEQPKQFVLHFVALFIAVAWAFDLALGQRRVREV